MHRLLSIASTTLLLALTFGISGCEELGQCTVHEHSLSEKDVSIAYGIPTVGYDYTNSFAFQSARDSSFPREYLKNYIEGGCIVGPEDEMEITYCVSCNKAYQKWLSTNPDIIEYWNELPDSAAWGEADVQQYETIPGARTGLQRSNNSPVQRA